jgi:hypothetical protein
MNFCIPIMWKGSGTNLFNSFSMEGAFILGCPFSFYYLADKLDSLF